LRPLSVREVVPKSNSKHPAISFHGTGAAAISVLRVVS
jgi:hypothetical protein